MEKIIVKNWISNLLVPAMKENGCPSEIRTEEDVLTNLYYLSKEDGRGSRYIPLQYKRMIEKIVFGLFNTSFEYSLAIQQYAVPTFILCHLQRMVLREYLATDSIACLWTK